MKNTNGKPAVKKSAAARNKTILIISSGALLVILLVAGAVAWYTRTNTVEQLAMKAAQFDYRANYQGKNFYVYAEDYITLEGKAAAPGTIGVIPMKISADKSDTDIEYSLSINTNIDTMADEMKRHIRFFYYTNEDNPQVISWGKDNTLDPIQGTIKAGDTEQYEYIYWEWVWDLNEAFYYDTDAGKWVAGEKTIDGTWKKTFKENEKQNFDQVDTNIGLGEYDDKFPLGEGKYITSKTKTDPVSGVTEKILAYQIAMSPNIDITGAQAKPIHKEELPATETAEGARNIRAGSRYMAMDYVLEHNKPE